MAAVERLDVDEGDDLLVGVHGLVARGPSPAGHEIESRVRIVLVVLGGWGRPGRRAGGTGLRRRRARRRWLPCRRRGSVAEASGEQVGHDVGGIGLDALEPAGMAGVGEALIDGPLESRIDLGHLVRWELEQQVAHAFVVGPPAHAAQAVQAAAGGLAIAVSPGLGGGRLPPGLVQRFGACRFEQRILVGRRHLRARSDGIGLLRRQLAFLTASSVLGREARRLEVANLRRAAVRVVPVLREMSSSADLAPLRFHACLLVVPSRHASDGTAAEAPECGEGVEDPQVRRRWR